MRLTFGLRQKRFYTLGSVGNGVFGGFNNAVIPIWLQNFTSSSHLTTYLSNTSTIEGVLLQPIIGRWSNRTTSRLGGRKPFILAGIPFTVLFLLLTPVFALLLSYAILFGFRSVFALLAVMMVVDVLFLRSIDDAAAAAQVAEVEADEQALVSARIRFSG